MPCGSRGRREKDVPWRRYRGCAERRWRAKDCKPSGGEARRRPDRTASVERKRQKIRSKEKEACVHYQMTTEQQGEDNAAAELSRQQVIAGKIAQQLERQRGRRATAACAWLRGRPSWATSCPPPRAAASTGRRYPRRWAPLTPPESAEEGRVGPRPPRDRPPAGPAAQEQRALDRKKVSEERMRGRATLTRTSVTGDGGRQRRREKRGESRKRRRSEKAFQCDEKRAAAWLAARTAQWRHLVERRLAEEAAAEQADGDERGAGGVVRAGEAGAGPEQRPQEGGELGRRRILSAGKNSDC